MPEVCHKDTMYMTDRERARLESLCRERRVRPGEDCPMEGCTGHLEVEHKELVDFTDMKKPALGIEVLMCSREVCKFRGIVPEREGDRIKMWQGKGAELRAEAQRLAEEYLSPTYAVAVKFLGDREFVTLLPNLRNIKYWYESKTREQEDYVSYKRTTERLRMAELAGKGVP